MKIDIEQSTVLELRRMKIGNLEPIASTDMKIVALMGAYEMLLLTL